MTTPENGRAGLKSCDPDTDLALKNTSAAVPMKQTPAVDLDQEFLARVVPWPTTEAPGYINLHWFRPDKPDGTKGRMSGAPHTQIADFMGLARWGVTKPSIMTDIFFCLSLQSR